MKFKLLSSAKEAKNGEEKKEEIHIPGVEAPRFGIKSYIHQFYHTPTKEDLEGSWYLLPNGPSPSRGNQLCRALTIISLVLIVFATGVVLVGYLWPHEPLEEALHRVYVAKDRDGTLWLPRESLRRLRQLMRDPMRSWKLCGLALFTVGGLLLIVSLAAPVFAQLSGIQRLAGFSSESEIGAEPPIRIFPNAESVNTGEASGPKSPVEASQKVAKVQPDANVAAATGNVEKLLADEE